MDDAAANLLARCGAVIVAHSGLEHAQSCVASLRRDLPPERILLVLNDPRVVSSDQITELMADALVVSPVSPTGYGANLNLGVGLLGATVDVCVLANDDVVFAEGALLRMLGVLDRHPSVGIVGANIVSPDNTVQLSSMPFPSVRGELGLASGLKRPRRPAAAAESHRIAEPGGAERHVAGAEMQVGWVIGAALVVRVDAFRAVRGFDEDFFLHYEETDLCWRVIHAGWTIAMCGEARVTHIGRSSIPPPLAATTLRAGRGLYLRKRLGPIRWRVFQTLLGLAFLVGCVHDVAHALVHPRAARARVKRIRERWHNRFFLRRG